MQVQSNGAGASASETVEAMEAADHVAGLQQQQDQRDYQKSKGQRISRIYSFSSIKPRLFSKLTLKYVLTYFRVVLIYSLGQ